MAILVPGRDGTTCRWRDVAVGDEKVGDGDASYWASGATTSALASMERGHFGHGVLALVAPDGNGQFKDEEIMAREYTYRFSIASRMALSRSSTFCFSGAAKYSGFS